MGEDQQNWHLQYSVALYGGDVPENQGSTGEAAVGGPEG